MSDSWKWFLTLTALSRWALTIEWWQSKERKYEVNVKPKKWSLKNVRVHKWSKHRKTNLSIFHTWLYKTSWKCPILRKYKICDTVTICLYLYVLWVRVTPYDSLSYSFVFFKRSAPCFMKQEPINGVSAKINLKNLILFHYQATAN